MDLNRYMSRRDEIGDVRGTPLTEQEHAGSEHHDLRPVGDEVHGLGREARQERVPREQTARRLVHAEPLSMPLRHSPGLQRPPR